MTGYGLEDGDIEVRVPMGQTFLFSTSPIPVLGPTQPPVQWVPEDLFTGVRQPEP
jgi:hypothetical protein